MKWGAVGLVALASVNLVVFARLGLWGRVEFAWGLGFGAVDLLIGSGFFLAAGWVPWVLLDDPREARVFMLLLWLLFGSIMLLSS